MASSQKTIKINPDLFKLNHTAKRRQPKLRRERPVISVKPNQIKKELLNKIKELQKKEEEIEKSKNVPLLVDDNTTKDNDFNDEFNKSLNFLQELTKNNARKADKREKRHNKSIRRQAERDNIKHEINIDLPEELRDFNDTVEIYQNPITLNTLSSNIPYGCLKNGNKPTFREWKRQTQKIEHRHVEQTEEKNEERQKIEPLKRQHRPRRDPPRRDPPKQEPPKQDPPKQDPPKREPEISTQIPTQIVAPEKMLRVSSNKSKIEPLELNTCLTNIAIPENLENRLDYIEKPKEFIKKNIRTTRYRLGKQGRNVSILIKNNETRKNIKDDFSKLKRLNILDIKNYLRKHNLIKVGSNAPNDVLRQIYENSVLSGKITNLSNENLMHNFLSDK